MIITNTTDDFHIWRWDSGTNCNNTWNTNTFSDATVPSDRGYYPIYYYPDSFPVEEPEPIIFFIPVPSYKDFSNYLSGRSFVVHHFKLKSKPFIKRQICRKQFKQLKTFKNLRFK